MRTHPADRIPPVICSSVQMRSLPNNVREVITPFLDWKGAPVSIYVREQGEVTDGGETLSELRALRVIDEWEEWTFKEDFLQRYCIRQKDESLIAAAPEDPEAILRYAQGISRLARYFEAKPISQRADYFPQFVQSKIKPLVEQVAPPDPHQRDAWINVRMSRQKWTYHGVSYTTDYTPVSTDVMIQVISYAKAEPSAQKGHVSDKVLPYAFLRKDRPGLRFVAVMNALEEYTPFVQKLLRSEAKRIIEFRTDESANDLVRVLTRSDLSEVLG